MPNGVGRPTVTGPLSADAVRGPARPPGRRSAYGVPERGGATPGAPTVTPSRSVSAAWHRPAHRGPDQGRLRCGWCIAGGRIVPGASGDAGTRGPGSGARRGVGRPDRSGREPSDDGTGRAPDPADDRTL